MGDTMKLGRVLCVKVAANWSVLVIFVLIVWGLAVNVLLQDEPGRSHPAYWAVGMTTEAPFFLYLLAHELSHAIMARRNGLTSPKESQRPCRRHPAPATDRAAAMRTSIAELMSRSKREIPHYYLSATIDLDPALTWIRRRNRDLEVTDRLVPATLLLKAAARALAEIPALNGSGGTAGSPRAGECTWSWRSRCAPES